MSVSSGSGWRQHLWTPDMHLDVMINDLALASEKKFTLKSSHHEAPPMIVKVGQICAAAGSRH
jgi:hypothetical protein